MKPKTIGWLIGGVAAFVLLLASVYTVNQREQAVITRLGEIRYTQRTPGLHLKMPFVDQVHTFNKMMMESDPTQEDQIYTADKKILLVDNYAIWQIVDPIQYLQAFPGGETYAERRLSEVVFSALRQELGRHTQDDVVVTRRETVMDSVTAISDRAMRQTGVRVLDTRIKRADLPPENAQSVYGRMVAERQREATRYRSHGEREGNRIMSQADRDAQVLLARARQREQEVRGRGDSRAIETYAKAYQRDPAFFEFMRSMEAYESALDSQTVFLLSRQSPFLKEFMQRR